RGGAPPSASEVSSRSSRLRPTRSTPGCGSVAPIDMAFCWGLIRATSTIMPTNLFHAPIHGMIECQNGRHTRIFGSDPASPGRLPEDNHVFITLFQDRRAEVAKV